MRAPLLLLCGLGALAAPLLGGVFAAPADGGTGGAATAAQVAPPPAPLGYTAPVPGPVLRPFEPPPTPYAAGHRGVDLAAGQGEVVRAAGRGVVRFAGPVAGRGVVVIAHPDGVTTEYEPVRPLVRVGAAVAGGGPIGRLAGTHAGCPGPCLHWGARRGRTYLDPLQLLRPLGPVVLLPWPRDG